MPTIHLLAPHGPCGHDIGVRGPTHSPFKVRRLSFHLSLTTFKGKEASKQPSHGPGDSALITHPLPSLPGVLGLPAPHFLSFKTALPPRPLRRSQGISPVGLVLSIDEKRQIAFALITAKTARGGMHKRITKSGYLLKMRRKMKITGRTKTIRYFNNLFWPHKESRFKQVRSVPQ